MDTTKYDYERGWIQMLFSTRQGGLHVRLHFRSSNKKQSHFFVPGKLPWGTSLQKSLQMQIRSDHIWVHRQPGRRWGRVSVSTSLRGSMTVEASLIMSLFLLMISVLFSLFQLISYQTEIQFYLEEAVRNQAIYGVPEAGIPASVRNLTPGTGLELGESGLSMIRNGKMRADYLEFTVCYEAGPALHVFGAWKGTYLQRSRRRFWNGQERILDSGENDEKTETYVYITQRGTVYHRSRSCSYLALSIQGIAGETVASRRNKDGETYKACEVCVRSDGAVNGTVYVTDWGSRYHRNRGCTGLRRWIIKIPESETGRRGECSRCGA